MMIRKTLRIRYAKSGLLRFIGHLDTTRLLTRALARSSVPALYSQGFSPHMKVSFGPSLPLGVSSRCEYVDVQIDEAEAMNTPEEWAAELQTLVPDGLAIMQAGILDDGAPPLSESIDRARYQISVPQKFTPTNEKLVRFLRETSICVEKRSRKGPRILDIRPAIESLERLDNPNECSGLSDFELVIKMGQSEKATPALVIKALLGRDWETVPGLRIHRRELYSSSGLPLLT